MLVLDDSLQIKINSSKYFGLKFAATGPSYQFNSDSFVRLLDEKNYTEWLVPKTGGSFSGNVRFKTNIYFDSYGVEQNINGVNGIYFKNATTVSGNGLLIFSNSPQNPNEQNSQCNFLINGRGNLIIGSGESAGNLHTFYLNHDTDAATYPLKENEFWARANEVSYLLSDGRFFIMSNCQTIENRQVFIFDTAGNLLVPTNTTATKKVRNIAYQNGGTVSTIANGDIVLVY